MFIKIYNFVIIRISLKKIIIINKNTISWIIF